MSWHLLPPPNRRSKRRSPRNSGRRAASEIANRGESLGGVSGEFNNSYLMIACDAEQVSTLVELIRPVLKRFGGVALVSDALWVKH